MSTLVHGHVSLLWSPLTFIFHSVQVALITCYPVILFLAHILFLPLDNESLRMAKTLPYYLLKPHLIVLFLCFINITNHNNRNKKLLLPRARISMKGERLKDWTALLAQYMWVLLSLFQAGVSSLMSQLSRKAPGIETNTHPGCAGKRWILTSLMAQLLLLTWLSLLSWKDPPSWTNPSSHFHSLLFFTSAELKD